VSKRLGPSCDSAGSGRLLALLGVLLRAVETLGSHQAGTKPITTEARRAIPAMASAITDHDGVRAGLRSSGCGIHNAADAAC